MAKSNKVHQLDFFIPTADEINAKRIEEVQESLHKVRKGAYANIGEINKRLMKIEDMLEHMVRAICRGENENVRKN
jgi:hypothetical protein